MIVVVFEVTVKPEVGNRYFDLAAELRPALEGIEGFISVERFQSLATENKFVSISFWENESAVAKWRAHSRHGEAQLIGKKEIFDDFRISVAEISRQYTLADRTGQ